MKQIIRTENNFVSRKDILNKLQIHDNVFEELLLSGANPNYDFFMKIKGGIMDIFNEYSNNKTFNQILKEGGWKDSIEKCNYQDDIAYKFMHSKIKGNISRYKKEYREYKKYLMSKELQENNLTSKLREIECLLKVGWIIALYLKADTEKMEEIKIETENLKKCPKCAELVKKEASVCKHCGNDLTATLKEEPIKFDEVLKVEKKENVKKIGDGDYPTCSNCNGRVSRTDKKCSHCGSTFEV